MNRAELARELGVHSSSIRKYSQELGLDFAYHTPRDLKPDEISRLIERATFSGHTCSLCREKGHSRETCPTSSELRVCTGCGFSKPRDEFYIGERPSQKGRYLFSYCKSCDFKRTLSRRSTLEGRARAAIRTAKERAGEENVTLSAEDIVEMYESQQGFCYYSGLKMTWERGSHGFSLDRKNNDDRSYSKENVVLCCLAVNKMKYTMDVEEFLHFCHAISEHQTSQTPSIPQAPGQLSLDLGI